MKPAQFQIIYDDEEISTNILTMVLIIESPVFKKDNKWRFNTGGNSFYATVDDVDFLNRVEAGSELFGKAII